MKFLLGRVVGVSIHLILGRGGGWAGESLGLHGGSLTLDGFGVLLDLTVRGATDHVPHYDFPRGVSRSQAQTVRSAQVVVVVFPGPFHLPNTKHILNILQLLWKHGKISIFEAKRKTQADSNVFF